LQQKNYFIKLVYAYDAHDQLRNDKSKYYIRYLDIGSLIFHNLSMFDILNLSGFSFNPILSERTGLFKEYIWYRYLYYLNHVINTYFPHIVGLCLFVYWILTQHSCSSVVNFINILRTNFLLFRQLFLFSSYMFVEKAAKTMFVRKNCM